MAMAELPEVYPNLNIIETGRVSPPVNSVPASSLPLSLFDIPWMLNLFPQQISFYEVIALSNSEFTQKLVPALKSSLSIALKHFYPLAGKLVVPCSPAAGKPRIMYSEGDSSVVFRVAESMEDFEEVSSNDPRDVKLLHSLVPQLPPPWDVSDEGICTRSPLFAVQVTLFPNSGMCLGMQLNHAVCDARSLQRFMKSWASICKTGDLHSSLVPIIDKAIIEDPSDLQTTLFKSLWRSSKVITSSHGLPPVCTDQRATFILSRATITRLNTWISKQSTILHLLPMHISSFAAAGAFTWICIAKSMYNHEDDTNNNINKKPQLCHFRFLADCRNRLETPVPETYFGNCVVICTVAMEKKTLLGRDGITLAARAIAQKVEELEKSRGASMLTWAEKCFKNFGPIDSRSGDLLVVAGSPQLDFYDADFGWGRPKMFFTTHIERERCTISLGKSRDEKMGGMEIVVALSNTSMVAFTSLFTQLELGFVMDDFRAKL